MTENNTKPQVAVDVWLSDKKEPKEKTFGNKNAVPKTCR
jgi:hypothetical protein